MTGFRSFREYSTLVLVGVVGLIESYVVVAYAHAPSHVFDSLLALIGVLFLVGVVLSALPEHSRRFRALWLGRDFVEGVWFDKIDGLIDDKETYGLISIEYVGGELRQYGKNYQVTRNTSDNSVTISAFTTWRSDGGSYADGQFVLINRVANVKAGFDLGASVTQFDRSRRAPLTFYGTILRTADPSMAKIPGSFHGFKITDKNVLAQLEDVSTPLKDRAEVIEGLIADPRLRLR